MAAFHTLDHPIIGKVKGTTTNDVVQFRGIQYATLENRLATPRLVEYRTPGVVDATNYGAPVVSPPEGLDIELSIIQQDIPREATPQYSDLHCLNLNITTPVIASSQWTQARLPVFVYIHGGAYIFGSGSYPHYDPAKVVAAASAKGCPIIAINLNYRLGAPGFLTSKELQDAGYTANNGLRDQQTALRWIKRYVAGFGGDPEAVTVAGHSAGAASVTFHLNSEESLFNAAILLSGSSLLLKPLDIETANSTYDQIIQSLGLVDSTSENRISQLLNISPEELLSVTGFHTPLGPVVDGDIVPVPTSFEDFTSNGVSRLPGQNWCHRLLTSYCSSDGAIFAQTSLRERADNIGCSFRTFLATAKDVAAVEVLDETYGISTSASSSDAMMSIVDLLTDIFFGIPAIRIASCWKQSSVKVFAEQNPWSGPYKGSATHFLDIAYLFQNFNTQLLPLQRAVAEAFAEDLVTFTADKENEKLAGSVEEAILYGPSGRGTVRLNLQEDELLNSRIKTLLEVANRLGGLDTFGDAMMAWVQGQRQEY